MEMLEVEVDFGNAAAQEGLSCYSRSITDDKAVGRQLS